MVIRIQTRIWLLSTVLLVATPMLVAQATTADTSVEVDQFKQWLQQQDQKNADSLAQYQPSAPTTNSAARDDHISNAAFDELLKKTMPMTPDQIHAFKQAADTTQRAVATPANAPPKPMSSTLLVSLAPGEQPPAIKMSQGFISSLVFVDASGAAWPIDAYDLGNSQAFNVQWDKKTNVMMIQPLQPYTYANLAVRLKGLTPPVMLTLVPGQAVVDYRVDVTVMGQGPNSSGDMSHAGLPKDANSTLLGVLDGIPPQGSQVLTVSDGAGQAWSSGDVIYFRSRYTVLSPAWLDSMQSPDGMHAYQLPQTPLLLISKLGKPVEVKLQGE